MPGLGLGRFSKKNFNVSGCGWSSLLTWGRLREVMSNRKGERRSHLNSSAFQHNKSQQFKGSAPNTEPRNRALLASGKASPSLILPFPSPTPEETITQNVLLQYFVFYGFFPPTKLLYLFIFFKLYLNSKYRCFPPWLSLPAHGCIWESSVQTRVTIQSFSWCWVCMALHSRTQLIYPLHSWAFSVFTESLLLQRVLLQARSLVDKCPSFPRV